MMKTMRALNEQESSNSSLDESSSDDGRPEKLSKEAAEDEYFEKYKEALLLIKGFFIDQARDMLESLYDELEELDNCDAKLMHLKFSVLKNLGHISPQDIDPYIKAFEIDATDVSLWIKAGEKGLKLSNWQFARQCFESALEINPNNMIAIDRLLELYYVLHLPYELNDLCLSALEINKGYKKARIMLSSARSILPCLNTPTDVIKSINDCDDIIGRLDAIKEERRYEIQVDMKKIKRQKASITLDTSRTQSFASFGEYIIKAYQRFARFGITRNTPVEIMIDTSISFSSQQSSNVVHETQATNHSSSEPQTTSSQDIEMSIEGDCGSTSENEKFSKTDMPQDEMSEQAPKSSSKAKNASQARTTNVVSFTSLLFPSDVNDKRRSSRNRAANQDDNMNVKQNFDELNNLLPPRLRIEAIDQLLQEKNKEKLDSEKVEQEKKKMNEPKIVESNLMPVKEDLVIKEIISTISQKVQFSAKNDLKMVDLFSIFLTKLAEKKQNKLPEVFIKVYKLYRQISSFPTGVFIDIGTNGMTIEDFWLTLAANEICYKKDECLFLLRALNQLEIFLDDSKFKEFSVRLYLILGQNEHSSFLETVLDMIEEDTKIYASNRKTITRAFIKTLIDRRNEELKEENQLALESDSYTDLIEKLAPKSENEMSDREVAALCSAIISTKMWQRGLDILNQRNDLNLDIIVDTINKCLKENAKMDAILASKLCKEAVTNPKPQLWSCIYRGWTNSLTKEQLEEEKTFNDINRFFELGHQTLGKKMNCVSDGGEFLFAYVEHALSDNDNYNEKEVYGAMSCLFNYPNKKPPYVVHHKAQPVPLKWEYATTVYRFVYPDEMPTYMSLLRKAGITSETEQLMREIVNLVPPENNPVNSVKSVNNFIELGEEFIPPNIEKNDITEDIYFLLADYYFKNKDFVKAREFYALDLTLNPDRYDSWAASALIRSNEIDRALSDGSVTLDSFINGQFYSLIEAAFRCFDKATNLLPNEKNGTLWIEYGNVTYNLSSLAKRMLNIADFDCRLNASSENQDQTKKLKQLQINFLAKSKLCFTAANTLCQSEEIWLHYYMFGKIAEKQKCPFKALDCYQKADNQLFIEGATYPRKIHYHNPPEFACEAMEIHYRIHTVALKFLLSTTNIKRRHLKQIYSHLIRAHRSPFVTFEGRPKPQEYCRKDEMVSEDVDFLLDDLCESVSMTQVNFDELIYMCLDGLKRCIVRCSKNFKALYRLAQYYSKIEDQKMAQSIFLAREISTDRRVAVLLASETNPRRHWRKVPADMKGVDSLFKDRRIGNFYCNIWRMSAEEIDRPGSFEHWMYRCTNLLICICARLCDSSMLATIAFQLSKGPEISKKYLHDKARVLLTDFAVKSILAVTMKLIGQSSNEAERQQRRNDGIAICERFIKAGLCSSDMQALNTFLLSK